MKTYICSICGWSYEGETVPEICPVCSATSERFFVQDADASERDSGGETAV